MTTVPFECCIRLTAKCGSQTRIPLQPYEGLFLTTATTQQFVYISPTQYT